MGVAWDREQIKTLKINRINIKNGDMVMSMEVMRDMIEEITGITTVIWAMGNMMVGTTGVIETWEIFTRSGRRRGRGGC